MNRHRYHNPLESHAGKFGFAVAGLGQAGVKFIEDLRRSDQVYVAAVITSHREHAIPIARKYQIPTIYDFREGRRIADDPRVQAVYIATPNSLHLDITKLAVTSGKHVLCEKPMAPTVSECEEMIDICRGHHRTLMIAYRCVHDATYQRMLKLLSKRTLGELLTVKSQFGVRLHGEGWRLNPAHPGGGSLYDLGIYSITALHDALIDISVTSAFSQRNEAGVEIATEWHGSDTSKRTSIHCKSSYVEKLGDWIHFTGERGHLLLQPAFSYGRPRLSGTYIDQDSGRRVKVDERSSRSASHLFCLEAEQMARCVESGVDPTTPGESGCRDISFIEQISRSTKSSDPLHNHPVPANRKV